MTQKERVMQHCKEHLQGRNLLNCFDNAAFEHVFRKQHGNQRNAYTFGLTVADYMILNPPKNFTNDTGNAE